MTEKKGKEKPLDYEQMWAAIKSDYQEKLELNPNMKLAQINIDEIERICEHDAQKCWDYFWNKVRELYRKGK